MSVLSVKNKKTAKEIKNDTAPQLCLMFCTEAFCPILQNASHAICKFVQVAVKITLKIIVFYKM